MSVSYKRLCAFPEAYINSGCNKAQAARSVGITRKQIQRWQDRYEDFRELINDIEESLIDLSESALLMHIIDGNPIANLFHLKTKGRGRGYIEQPRMGGDGSGTSFSDGLEMVKEQIKNNPRLMKKIEEWKTKFHELFPSETDTS